MSTKSTRKSTRKRVLPWSVRKFQSKFSHFAPIRCNLCAAIRVGQQPHFSTKHFLKLANVDLNQTQPCLSYWLRLIKDTKICLCGMACRLITAGKHETFRFYCRSMFQIHVFCLVAFSYLHQPSKTYLPQLQTSSQGLPGKHPVAASLTSLLCPSVISRSAEMQ